MAFKLGSETREFRGPIIRKKLAKGIIGEANNDGSIFIDKEIKSVSEQEKTVIKHEGKHAEDMKTGVLAYGDDYIRYQNKTYPRKGGKIKYQGKWYKEGSNAFPWEKVAVKAEKTKQEKITDGRAQSAAFQKTNNYGV